MAKTYHQGDVVLIPCKIPKSVREVRKDIIQHGEITGHAHRINGSVVLKEKDIEYVRVPKNEPMTHEDHPSKEIPKGEYKKVIHQEYFPDGSRQVKD